MYSDGADQGEETDEKSGAKAGHWLILERWLAWESEMVYICSVLTTKRLGGPAMRTVGILLVLALSSTLAQAHPGRTANDGCHYCRTNCSAWGVPKNQRHCHYKAEPQNLEEGLLKVSSPTREYEPRVERYRQEGHSSSHTHQKHEDVVQLD